MVKGNELELFGVFCNIFEWALDCIQIMCSNGSVLSCPAKGIMKFFLCGNEGFIGLLIKSDISQDGSCDKWSDLFNLNSECLTEGSTVIDVVGLVSTTSGIYYFPR